MTVNTVSWMINVAAPWTWKVIEVQKMKAKKYWMTYKQDTVQTPTQLLKEIGPDFYDIIICIHLVWTLILGRFPIVTAKTCCGGMRMFGSWGGTATRNFLICIKFFNNICLLRKFHFNQGQSSIQCPSLMSRFRQKWRREQGFVHVYGK